MPARVRTGQAGRGHAFGLEIRGWGRRYVGEHQKAPSFSFSPLALALTSVLNLRAPSTARLKYAEDLAERHGAELPGELRQPGGVPEGEPADDRLHEAGHPCGAAVRPPSAIVSYTAHGSTVFNPAASNGEVSRVATIMPLAAAVAAM